METYRLIDAAGNFLVDAAGNNLVFQLGGATNTGRMGLRAAAPTIALTVNEDE